MKWEEFKKHLKNGYSNEDKALVRKAFDKAAELYAEDKRLSGEPYLSHLTNVALKIAELKLDAETLAAALLHDVLEDKKITPAELLKEFGETVAFLVDGVTRIDEVKYHGMEQSVESIRKMFLAVAKDIRVVLLKLMDRTHNLETLDVFPKERQKRKALETLEIYAPAANRLGMGEIKARLEDLAFQYVFPEEYGWLISQTKEKMPERQKYLEKIMPLVKEEIEKEGIKILSIHSRAKHYYSLWKKLGRYNMDWSQIADLVALRIIVENVEDCYRVLGIIHHLWKPLPGKIKDYIALPKPNGYQSLHTTVFCQDGVVTEFQVRTPAMHREAEYGIAAYWAYEETGKEAKAGKKVRPKKFEWAKQLTQWQKEFQKEKQSPAEFLESLKIDLFKDRIFVLTPKGDVIDLPEGATPVDFAYHLHSEIGDRMAGAKVNGKMVSFSQALSSGDIVEIITSRKQKPKSRWLEFAKTRLAKGHIRSAVKKHGYPAK